jgi:hypothetical protein
MVLSSVGDGLNMEFHNHSECENDICEMESVMSTSMEECEKQAPADPLYFGRLMQQDSSYSENVTFLQQCRPSGRCWSA